MRTGAALETLPKIEAEGLGPFDFVFIDADKDEQRGLSRMGAQAFPAGNRDRGRQRGAGTARSPTRGARIRTSIGVRRMFEMMAREPRLSATAIQTVGAKGWDGFALAVVK